MSHSASISRGPGPADEAGLWLPPRRMLRYQLAKLGGAAVAGGIFAGWLIIQWSSLPMRFLAGALLLMTVWITFNSVISDVLRSHGRQLAVLRDELLVRTPAGQERFRVADIAWARWQDDTDATFGLWLYNQMDQPMAHLDAGFLADENEARTFLHWVRQRCRFTADVRWPEVD